MIRSRLKSLRLRMNLSQEELSKKLGMARTTYAGYENGSRDPDPDTLKKIAEFHSVSVDYILGMDETVNDQAKNAVLEKYARLPQEKKKIIDDLIKMLEQQQ